MKRAIIGKKTKETKTVREIKVTSAHGHLMKNEKPFIPQSRIYGILSNPNRIQFKRSALFDWAQKNKLGKVVHAREIKTAAELLGAGVAYMADGGFYRSIKGVAKGGAPVMSKNDNRFFKPVGDKLKHEYMLFFRK